MDSYRRVGNPPQTKTPKVPGPEALQTNAIFEVDARQYLVIRERFSRSQT